MKIRQIIVHSKDEDIQGISKLDRTRSSNQETGKGEEADDNERLSDR